jgi:uncharacterized membrane protein YkvA (DUF1232 family)
MTTGQWLLLSLAVALVLYGTCVGGLVVAGRRNDDAAVARFIPDCIVLFRRLVADPRVPRARKLLLVALIAYLAMPFDLIPDFIPVAGQLDDAILVALVLRTLLRATDPALAAELWPGPQTSLAVILRLAGVTADQPGGAADAEPPAR